MMAGADVLVRAHLHVEPRGVRRRIRGGGQDSENGIVESKRGLEFGTWNLRPVGVVNSREDKPRICRAGKAKAADRFFELSAVRRRVESSGINFRKLLREEIIGGEIFWIESFDHRDGNARQRTTTPRAAAHGRPAIRRRGLHLRVEHLAPVRMPPEVQPPAGENVHREDLKLKATTALAVAFKHLAVFVDAPIAKRARRFATGLDDLRVASFQSLDGGGREETGEMPRHVIDVAHAERSGLHVVAASVGCLGDNAAHGVFLLRAHPFPGKIEREREIHVRYDAVHPAPRGLGVNCGFRTRAELAVGF